VALIIKDRIRDTSTTTGTGDITVSGSPPTGSKAFGSVMSTGDTSVITIQNPTAGEWEICETSYSGSNVLTRGALLASSTGSRVSFSAGTKDVWIDFAAAKVVDVDRPQTLTNKTLTDPIVGTQTARDNSVKAASTAYVDGAIREKLAADRTYYVRTDGADSNNGLTNTSGGAFLTIQKAIDTAVSIDLSIYKITIQLTGSYTEAPILKSFVGVGPIVLLGDETTPSNCTITGTGSTSTNIGIITADRILGSWEVRGVKLTSSVAGQSGLRAAYGTIITMNAIDFGSLNGGRHTDIADNAILLGSSWSISGNATHHLSALQGGMIRCSGAAVTLSGTPAFATAFAYASSTSAIRCQSMSFTGSATGARYLADANGVIYTNGGGASYFPGNSVGSVATGGQYI
jgi:hypothetical protein